MFLALIPLLYAASTSALAPSNMRLQYLGSRDGGVASLSCIDPYLNRLYLSVEVADERKLNEYILQIESPVVKKKLLTATEYQALSQVDTAKFITDAPLLVARIKSAASLSDAVNVVATAKNSETSCYGAAFIKTKDYLGDVRVVSATGVIWLEVPLRGTEPHEIFYKTSATGKEIKRQLLAVYGVAKVLPDQLVVLENCVAPGVDKFGITIKYDGDLVHASTNKAMCALSLLPREERRQVLATFLCQSSGSFKKAGARLDIVAAGLRIGCRTDAQHLDVSSSLPRRKDWQLSSYLHRQPIDDGLHRPRAPTSTRPSSTSMTRRPTARWPSSPAAAAPRRASRARSRKSRASGPPST